MGPVTAGMGKKDLCFFLRRVHASPAGAPTPASSAAAVSIAGEATFCG